MAYNTTMPPFDKVEVRKALNMAVNKQAIIDAVYQGAGQAAVNPIPPTMWGYNTEIKDDPYDPEAAKKMLEEAGVKDLSMKIWAMPVSRPYNPNAQRVAELIQADYAKVGVKAEIVSYEWTEYRERGKQKDRDGAFQLGWTGDNGDPDNFLFLLGCSAIGQSNYAIWCNKEFEDLLQKGKATTDQAERTKIYEEAQVVFKREAPWLTIAHSKVFMPMSQERLGLHDGSARHPPLRRRRHRRIRKANGDGALRGRRLAIAITMFRYILHKLALIVPTIFGISLAAFAFVRLLPGDPILAMAGERGVSPERYAELLERFGYNRPIWVQYFDYIGNVLHGDFGISLATKRPVIGEFLTLFPATLELATVAMLLAVIDRHSGRHLRGRQARLLVRPADHGRGPDRLFHADLLVGPAAHHLLLRHAGLDAGFRPHRPAIFLPAGHRLHADRQPAVGQERRLLARPSATSSCRRSCWPPSRSP